MPHMNARSRPTWLGINLVAIGSNVRRLVALAGVPLLVVLKADGYGHGALRVAQIALTHGAAALAVATLDEARRLRRAGIRAPILLLGYTPPWQAPEAVRLNVTCTIFDRAVAHALSAAAVALDREVRVHVKVDTGMARLGLPPAAVGTLLAELSKLPGLRVEGIYTHFATADSCDETFARLQLARFTDLLAELAAHGLRPPLAHAANSAALLRFPAARLDMVRPGIACYGLAPSAETPLPAGFQPALSFHTEIVQIKEVPAGTPISYGGTFVTQRPSRIATLPVGYADGLRRTPQGQMVLVHGQRVPVVGRVTMDYTLIDVTALPTARCGDAVILIGRQGAAVITADEVAAWLGTISYEVVATLLPRVPREIHGEVSEGE